MRTFREYYDRRLSEAVAPEVIQQELQKILPTLTADQKRAIQSDPAWVVQRAVQMSQRGDVSQDPARLIQMAAAEATNRANVQPTDLYAGQPGTGQMGPGDVH